MLNTPTPPDDPPVQRLFRMEALEHAGNRQFGTVTLAQPVSHKVLTLFFLVIGAVIVSFFALFETTRKAHCQGVLLPTTGVLRVMSNQVGVITEAHVEEGQLVQKGDILFVLSSERSSSSVGSTQQVVSTLLQARRASFSEELHQSARQIRQRITSARKRAADLEMEVGRLKSQQDMQQTRVSLAEQAFQRYQELQKTNFLSQAQLQEKQAELLDQRQRHAELERSALSVRRDLASTESDLRDLQIQAERDEAGLHRNIATLDQEITENEALREVVVRAPQSGVVTAITGAVGQTVAGNAVLASVLPAGAFLEAELYAPSRSIGFIKPGMTVLLRYQAYPYQKFGQYPARVRDIASTSLRPDELGIAPGGETEPLYRIRLKLDHQTILAYGKQMPLKSGMLIDGSVQLERRRLYEWVLEPLFSISGRL